MKKSGCHGFCEMGPLVRIEFQKNGKKYSYLYIKVKEEDCDEIYQETVLQGKLVAALRCMGFDKVYDTNFGADLTVMEE